MSTEPEAAPIVDSVGAKERRRTLGRALGVAAAVTAAVTVASARLPDSLVATVVGSIFLAATWILVWRNDDALVERSGLALGGLVLPGEFDTTRLVRSVGIALGWALAAAAVTFVPFYFGFRFFWHPRVPFALHITPWDFAKEVAGQILIIALPEEAFYRGYLQSRLDEAFPARVRIFGANVGPAIVVTSVIFAIGHFATIREPARLAVFFPSLLFGWLRARTKGVGAGVAFHAACNVYSELLGRGFRLYL